MRLIGSDVSGGAEQGSDVQSDNDLTNTASVSIALIMRAGFNPSARPHRNALTPCPMHTHTLSFLTICMRRMTLFHQS